MATDRAAHEMISMRTRAVALVLLGCFAVMPVFSQERTGPLNLALPTDNDALLRGDGANFYQVIDRDFQGAKSTPWEGGQYGFVRDPVHTRAGLVYKRFHEGIDIRPLHRDARGEPTDEVRAIADGTVVHTSQVAGFSNYGRYVVVEHRWGGASYYSLYAHLNSIDVQPNESVLRGQRLGVMGHTGAGIDRERAHVHLELNLMLSREFDRWYGTYFPHDPNRHGLYNGMNLVGLDIAQLYLALRQAPALTIPEFLAREKTFYKVLLPKSSHFDLPKRYPWLMATPPSAGAKSWEVSFAASGVPLKIETSTNAVTQPELSYCTKSAAPYTYLTREIIGGSGDHAHLTETGRRLMQLLVFPD